jgi:hypothetical protein
MASSTDLELGQSRAELVVRVEIRENSTFGLDTENNWVVGWPKTSEQFDDSITYPTDVVHYDFECHWEAPNFISSEALESSGDAHWEFLEGFIPNFDPLLSGQKPIYRGNVIRPPLVMNLTFNLDRAAISLVLPGDDTNNLIAFLFFGSNQTYQFPSTDGWSTILNLDGIPTTYNASGFMIQPYDGDEFNATAPLAAFLVCDPQLQIASGQAVIWPNGTLNAIKSSFGSLPRLGNFPDDNVKTLFTVGQRNVFQDVPDGGSVMVFQNSALNFNSAFTFLNDSSLSSLPLLNGQKGIFTLPIDQIQANLNTVFRSIAKAYSDGIRRDFDAGGIFAQDTTPVQGVTLGSAEGLVMNTNLFYIAIVLVSAELFLMGALCVICNWQTREPLNLRSIFAAMGKGVDAETQKRDLSESHLQ